MVTIQRGQSMVKIFVRVQAAKHTGAFWLVVVVWVVIAMEVEMILHLEA